jgi:hypothetical protein
MKEFQDKLNALISAFSADGSTTSGSLYWAKDGVQYSLALSVNGGSISATYSAYKPDPTPPNAIPATNQPAA